MFLKPMFACMYSVIKCSIYSLDLVCRIRKLEGQLISNSQINQRSLLQNYVTLANKLHIILDYPRIDLTT